MERGANERQPTGTNDNQRSWGDRMGGGAVTGGTNGGHVWVNCVSLGVGVTARIGPDEAEDFADRLYEWARAARQIRQGRRG